MRPGRLDGLREPGESVAGDDHGVADAAVGQLGECPRSRVTQEAFEQRHVGGREAVAIQLEELDADHASFMVALHPQEIDQANELVAGERGQGRCKRWSGHSPRTAHALLAERIDRQVDGTSRVS